MRRWSSLTVAFLLLLGACAAWIALSAARAGGKDPHIQYQWAAVAAVLVALCAVSGYLVNGRIDGILIDERNRLSLSRLQWVAWLVVLVAGYFTGAVFVVAGGKPDLPAMQAELFGLLGIVSGSAVISNLIVDSKKTAPPPTQLQQQALLQQQQAHPQDNPAQTGVIDRNLSIDDASWADLYYGEDIGNRYVVDISRLQKLVITVLLVMTYVVMLWSALGTAGAAGVFDKMPEVGGTFLGLLGVSHAAYLAYKATPKTPAV